VGGVSSDLKQIVNAYHEIEREARGGDETAIAIIDLRDRVAAQERITAALERKEPAKP
jgi:hypothetical protein